MSKPFPPVLREKKRYVKFDLISDAKFSEDEVKRTLSHKIFELLGTVGAADSGFKFLNFDEKSQSGEFKVSHTSVDLIKACLALVERINDQRVIVSTERTSGTLKALRKQ